MKRRKIGWIDLLVYRLFYWRWKPIFDEREDIVWLFDWWMDEYKKQKVANGN